MTPVAPLTAADVDEAAGLVMGALHDARDRLPLLPKGLGAPGRISHLLGALTGTVQGVVARSGDGIVGVLAGIPVPLDGSAGIYVPEWGHAVADTAVIPDLYAAAAEDWVASGRRVHAVTLWHGDEASEAAWHGLGFGRAVMDTVRDLDALPASDEVPIRRATVADAAHCAALELDLHRHLAAPPTFRVHPPPEGEAAMRRRLSDPERPIWLAGGDGYIALAPTTGYPVALDEATAIRCDGMWVAPGTRRRGIGRALLATALEWARGAARSQLILDYETANAHADRFWQAMGCRPALVSLARRLGDPSEPDPTG